MKNDDVCFVGIGQPSAACNLARLTHAPDITLIYESGTLATKPNVLPLSIGDGELCETALTTVSVPEMFRYWLQGGRIKVGFLGGAQIDRFANLNTTVVGPYAKPKVRLPGGGGAPEIATSCGEIFIIMAQGKRSFVDKLDFVTSIGHVTGGDSRAKLGVKTKGPTKLITDLALFAPDPETQGNDRGLHPSRRHPRADPGQHRLAGQIRRQCGGDAGADGARTRSVARTAGAHRARPCGRRRDGDMREAFICDAVRTPIGRYGGALAKVRTDDLAAVPIKALMARNPKVDWEKLDEVYYGCANQAGEDNRNVARMALLLAGLPASVPGVTHQPAVRFRAGSGRHRGARDPRRRDGFRHRRRRRIDDARALRAGQGATRPSRARPRSSTPPSAGASSIR